VALVAVGAAEAPSDLRDGTAILGLARAFELAGAGAVILPLWDPEEGPALALWSGFYAGLSRGLPAAEALAEARRKVAGEYPRPRAFAPFVIIGSEGIRAKPNQTLGVD
jgi:CHAT domain-containing protein